MNEYIQTGKRKRAGRQDADYAREHTPCKKMSDSARTNHGNSFPKRTVKDGEISTEGRQQIRPVPFLPPPPEPPYFPTQLETQQSATSDDAPLAFQSAHTLETRYEQ